MNTDTKLVIGAIAANLIVMSGAILYFGNQKPAPQRETLGTASMRIDRTSADLGTMKVSDERHADFQITNTGKSVLRLWNVGTSCDCTFATVKIGGEVSPEFTMKGMMGSSLTNWIGEIPAGQSAVLTVIYRPSVMPVSGPITRQVTFSTNDPNNPDLEVSIAANVES
ncbi:DUF1573 domain-containing protein [Patescibacteria group bacterium]|nr:DUF1573 domain-containing protein [Patescibacteria group bacterium]